MQIRKPQAQGYADKDGSFKRKDSTFRDRIAAGTKFAPESGRYHLYVSLACPWAHRTLITRVLKGLTPLIGVSIVHWHLDDNGWRFATAEEVKEAGEGDVRYGTVDQVNGLDRLSQLYSKAEKDYGGRWTVPVLWDKKLNTIVNNESSEIIRMFNKDFNEILPEKYAKVDLTPPSLLEQIDELNGWIYNNINNGVYKAGFASSQEVYSKEAQNVFDHLDKVEKILEDNHSKNKNYLLGDELTEADIRLYTTIVRFDPVYVQHFKVNLGMIRHDYPHINQWLKYLYWKVPGFQETTDFDHIKLHYTKSHKAINPFGITPIGPIPHIQPYE